MTPKMHENACVFCRFWKFPKKKSQTMLGSAIGTTSRGERLSSLTLLLEVKSIRKTDRHATTAAHQVITRHNLGRHRHHVGGTPASFSEQGLHAQEINE
mmetsp:Transcript_121016/g.241068  ORF Transcript_121016/g.241068 Transcript_121016/m.241068 type:complete len:99 (+) Transcript_121016:95-391(+)